MFEQTFQTSDIGVVAFLVLLEALLSADNALVLAIMVRHLPKEAQQRALLYGLGGAFVFRFIAILLAAYIISLWWAQAIGAGYLLWIAGKHFITHASKKPKPVGAGFWQTVIAVELADIAFAVDSVLAGVATIGNQKDKIWVVYFGALIGVVLLRFVASAFIRLLEKYPVLDHVAYLIVAWVGVKLGFMAGHNFGRAVQPNPLPFSIPEMSHAIFWSVLAIIAVVGTFIAVRNPREVPEEAEEQAEMTEDVQDMTIDEKA